MGGALTDCGIFERGFTKWPNVDWKHLYGSTEVEPVAVADARVAVSKSRARSYFQTLYLGQPIADIQYELEPNTVWVTGPHVCPRYLTNEEEREKIAKNGYARAIKEHTYEKRLLEIFEFALKTT